MEESLYNLAFERSILSSIIFDPGQFDEYEALLSTEDFYLAAHQEIYTAMLALSHRDQPIDEEFLKLELINKKKFDERALLEVLAANPISNTTAYIQEVKDKAVKRHLITLTTEIKRVALQEELEGSDVVDLVEKKLYEITQNSQTTDFKDAPTIADATLAYIEEMKARGDSILVGVDTGYAELNKMTTGFGKGDLVIIAARPAMGKCLGKGTNVLMFDGRLKKVEEVVVGDLLMGDDSTPRKVLSLARGREKMYWIRQEHGIDYRVNESHILSLRDKKSKEVLDIPLRNYVASDKLLKKGYKGYKVSVEFSEQPLEVDPYTFGTWLRDETRNNSVSLRKELDESTVGLMVSIGCRYIPHEYLQNSRKNRLKLLAGIVDGSGRYSSKQDVYEVFQKNLQLVKQIKLLADGLGFRTSIEVKKAMVDNDFYVEVYRLVIKGQLLEIPSKVHANFLKNTQKYKELVHTNIKVQYDCVDEYYGFVIDGNHRFLLEDMTVTHNTSFALNMVQNLLDKGKGVAFFSLEMPSEQLMLRLLSVQTSIQLQRLRVGDMNDEEFKRLNDAVEKMRNSSLYVDDHGSVNIHQLRSKLRKLKSRHPEIELAVIDYLQIMNGTGGKDRHLEVSEISRGLKMLARELNIPIVALSQLNRGLESRSDKRPMLSDIRESGSIEQDADIILFVYRNDVYLYKEEKEREKEAIASGKEFISKYIEKEEEEAEIIIGKQRNGPTGHVKLMFQKKFTRFVDRPTFGAAQIVYENIDMKSAQMNVNEDNVSMPII